MKYAIVGTGGRHQMFRDAVTRTHAETATLVGLCDNNQSRLALSANAVPDMGGNGVATYLAADFEAMLDEQRPDTVIVTVPDDLHDDYIVRALRAGKDVITEKPMTIDLGRLKRILDAQRETGRKITVSFNYRYSPARTQLKDMLMNGVIGEITAVDFRWYLDRVHGADYFRRWHRYKDRSGGLLVHKSTHHFDLINWWVGSVPQSVSAVGKRDFYTPQMAEKLGLGGHGARCHDCAVADSCAFRMDLEADEPLKQLYLDAEDDDGYWRDKCVFADDITIEDTMQVQAHYRSGTTLNYTLVAYSPWEGLEVKFHGTKGELTHRHIEVHGVFAGGYRERGGEDGVETITTELHLAGELPRKIDVWTGKGSHGGADPIMLGYLFNPEGMPEDKYGRASDQIAGAWSILTGIAANRSIAEGGARIGIDSMLKEAGITL